MACLGTIADAGQKDGAIYLATGLFQPIAADDVAGIVAEVALSAPRNGTIEIAGPERAPFDEIIRRYLTMIGNKRPVYSDQESRYFGGKVERFQGGERDLIIVSATVSDLAYAQSESDFLLKPRRLTVAVSRPKRKLIVLASQALFTLMPADLDDYERGALWKQLRHACASPPL